jgi:serine/threonine protein kinase
MIVFQPDEISRIPYRWMPAEAVSGLLTNSKSSGFYSKSTDVWSFAVIIYEMYSPVSPYESIKISGKVNKIFFHRKLQTAIIIVFNFRVSQKLSQQVTTQQLYLQPKPPVP